MMKSNWLLAGAMALVALAGPAFAQQGEGTGADFELRTGVNGATTTLTDKYMCEMDVLQVDYLSPMGTFAGNGLMLIGDVAPVSFDILEFGVIGTGINRFVMADGITQFGPVLPPVAGTPFTQVFAVPVSSVWVDGGPFNTNGLVADDWGIFVQAFVASPTGLFGLIEVSNTVKHEVDVECLWSETCGDAVLAGGLGIGLDDGDLGVAQTVNTTLFANDTSVNTSGLGTQGNFMLGDGSSGNARSKDAFTVFTATGGGLYTFSLCDSNYDTAMYLAEMDCVTGIISNDDNAVCGGMGPGSQFRSQFSIVLVPGQQVIVGIDGWSTGSAGVASLVITVDAGPVVLAQDVDEVDLAGGPVMLSGYGLGSINGVTVDGVAATNVVASFDAVSFDAPAMAAATGLPIVVSDGINTYPGGMLDYVDNSAPTLNDCSMPLLPFGGDVAPDVSVMDTITLAGAPMATVLGLNVDVDITHAWQGDVDIDLTSPDGTTVRLRQGDGTSGLDVMGNFPDTLPVDGPGTLADFVGENAEGGWTLTVSDNFPSSDDGVFNSWCITVEPDFAVAPLVATSSPAMPILSNMSATDPLMVADCVEIGSLTVDVDITHTWIGDVEIDLTSPAGTIVRLRDNTGGSNDDLMGNFPNTLAVSGPGTLADFVGELSCGLWEMTVTDTATGDDGTLNSWGLNFN